MKKYIFIVYLFALNFSNSHAQSGFENFFLADKEDAKNLLQGYFSSRINGYANVLNSNWYHTAEVHKPFGFDFSISVNTIVYPSNSKEFSLTGLTSVNLPSRKINSNTSTGNTNLRTTNVTTQINNEDARAIINLPTGENSSFLSNSNIPIAQLNIGVSNGFEVMLRLLPTIKPNNNNESLNVFGIGIKKEITNWFSSLKDKPLHISLLMSYANMNVNYGIKNQSLPSGNISGLEVLNGFSEFNLKTFTFQTLASYHFTHFNIFGGLAYNTGNASYETFGEFRGQYVTNSGTTTKDIDTSNSLDFNSNGVAATLGARLNLRYFKIFTSYNIQEFSTFNLGASISIK